MKIVLLMTLFFGSQASAKDLANYNGHALSASDFKSALETLGNQAEMVKSSPEFRQRFLEHLIDSELLSQEAMKAGLDKSPEFLAKLASARRDILASIYVERHIESEATDSKLKKYFQSNKEKFSDKEVKASHILFKENEKDKATKILKEAQGGADFSKLAKKYSSGPSGPKGGDLGYFKRGRMVPAFDQVAFSTPKGKLHPSLVKTRFGWHVIKVTDIRGGKAVTFKDKKDTIKRIRSKEIKEELLETLRKKAGVSIHEEAVRSLKF